MPKTYTNGYHEFGKYYHTQCHWTWGAGNVKYAARCRAKWCLHVSFKKKVALRLALEEWFREYAPSKTIKKYNKRRNLRKLE